MKFGPVPTLEAEGAILAHTMRFAHCMLAKGHRLAATDIEDLAGAGIGEVVVARLASGDVAEDVAVSRAAANLVGPNIGAADPAAGRVNLHARVRGLLTFDPAMVEGLNWIDEAIALAILPPYSLVEPGQIVASIKVIPFAVRHDVVTEWERMAAQVSVAPFVAKPAGLIQTLLPRISHALLEKTREVTASRLAALGSTLAGETRVGHKTGEVAGAIRARLAAGDGLVLICGASAITDRNDIIPSAIAAAGGEVDHFGMPVDPGNLLLLGHVGTVPVLGLPGCARSPSFNGVDHVLRRLLAGQPVGRREIVSLGVGGLLAGAANRPAP